MLHWGVEVKGHLVLQVIIEILQHHEVDIRAQVTDGGIQQLQLVLDAQLLELGAGGGIELGALAAVAHVDLVDIVHQLQGLLLADMLVKRAAEVIRDVVLPIGNAPAPPKPLMIEQLLHLMQVLTLSPSIGQWRFSRLWPASMTAIRKEDPALSARRRQKCRRGLHR